MGNTSLRLKQRLRRKLSIRKRVNGVAARPRLCVYKSARHIYAQVIDDVQGRTLVCASDLNPAELGEDPGKPVDRARKVGKMLAERCKAAGVERVVMDRNGFKYHGRIKALADGARAGGLDF